MKRGSHTISKFVSHQNDIHKCNGKLKLMKQLENRQSNQILHHSSTVAQACDSMACVYVGMVRIECVFFTHHIPEHILNV